MRSLYDSIEVCSHKQLFNYHDALNALLATVAFVSSGAQNVVGENNFCMG